MDIIRLSIFLSIKFLKPIMNETKVFDIRVNYCIILLVIVSKGIILSILIGYGGLIWYAAW